MLIIAVTGMPGSGKTVVSKRIAVKLGWPWFSMGDIVREETVKRGYRLTVKNIEKVASLLREELGRDAVALLLRKKLESLEGHGVVVDGMRSIYEARAFKPLGVVCIVAVHASPMTRYKRIISRKRKGDASSWEEFVLRDKSNLSYGIGELIALADYMLVNEGNVGDLLAEADKIAEAIASGKGKNCCGSRY